MNKPLLTPQGRRRVVRISGATLDGIPTSWWTGFALTFLLLALAPLVFSEYSLTLLAIYALLALSLAFVWGIGGILCFGQAAFYGLGAYTYAVASINLGESTGAVLLAVIVAGGAALALGAMMFYGRIGDVYLGVITLVVTLLLFKYANSTAGEAYVIGTARLGGFNGIPELCATQRTRPPRYSGHRTVALLRRDCMPSCRLVVDTLDLRKTFWSSAGRHPGERVASRAAGL